MNNEIFIHNGVTYKGSLMGVMKEYHKHRTNIVKGYIEAGVLISSEDYTFDDYLKEKGEEA